MKRILTAIIAIILALGVKAQIEEPRSILEIGVGGGLNLSKMEFQPTIRQFYPSPAFRNRKIRPRNNFRLQVSALLFSYIY